MKKKSYKLVLMVIGCVLSTNLLAHASTNYTSPNQYSINRIKNGHGESLVEYDFGSFMPHDDAYMKGYAQSSGYNRVHVYWIRYTNSRWMGKNYL